MWIKLLLCGLILGLSVGVGYLSADRSRARRNFYGQQAALNERFLSELSYTRTPLGPFLDGFNFTGDFEKAIAAVRTHSALPKLDFLSAEEKRDAESYFSMLGRGDAPSQLAYFRTQQPALERAKKESEEAAKKNGELGVKLGLLGGLAFVIFLL